MSSEAIMTRYATQLVLAGNATGCLLTADADQRPEHDNVVSLDAERTKRATVAWWRPRGF